MSLSFIGAVARTCFEYPAIGGSPHAVTPMPQNDAGFYAAAILTAFIGNCLQFH